MKNGIFVLIAIVLICGTSSVAFGSAPLRLSIVGKGFLAVQLKDGTIAYTRELFVQTKKEGPWTLNTSDGYALSPTIELFPLCEKHLIDDVFDPGLVSCKYGDTPISEGRIIVYEFGNPAALKPIGAGFYLETPESGDPRPAETADALMVGLKK